MKYLVFIPIVLLSVLTGCDSSKGNTYKSEQIANFVISCANQGNASLKQCGCIMDEIRNQVSSDKFLEWDTTLAAGNKPPEEFKNVLAKSKNSCL